MKDWHWDEQVILGTWEDSRSIRMMLYPGDASWHNLLDPFLVQPFETIDRLFCSMMVCSGFFLVLLLYLFSCVVEAPLTWLFSHWQHHGGSPGKTGDPPEDIWGDREHSVPGGGEGLQAPHGWPVAPTDVCCIPSKVSGSFSFPSPTVVWYLNQRKDSHVSRPNSLNEKMGFVF